jgi:hypothetical protein
VKRSGKDKPIWVAIHKCMETTQGISLYSYLYLKLAKYYAYYLLCFFLQQNWRMRGQNGFCLEVGGRWEVAQIMYTYVSKCKKIK